MGYTRKFCVCTRCNRNVDRSFFMINLAPGGIVFDRKFYNTREWVLIFHLTFSHVSSFTRSVVYRSPLTRVVQVGWPFLQLVKIFFVVPSIFPENPGFFFQKKDGFPGGRSVEQRGERGTKRDKKKFQFFSPHVWYVWWIDHTTTRAVNVWSRAASLVCRQHSLTHRYNQEKSHTSNPKSDHT